jgi:hypothetical protein
MRKVLDRSSTGIMGLNPARCMDVCPMFLWCSLGILVSYMSIQTVYCLYSVYHLKRNPSTITYHGTKMKSEACPPPCNRLSQPPRDSRVKVTLVARPLLMPVAQKICRCEHGVFTYTSLCREFSIKEFIGITREAWRNWNTILNRLLRTLTQKQFEKSQKHTKKGRYSRRWWAFSASAAKSFCKFFLTNKNWGQPVCVVVFMSPKLTNTVIGRVAF